jgi:hypothetical protein
MKSVLFTYLSPLGTFWIRPEPAGRVRLGFEREQLGTYASARAAADAVAQQKTGYQPWDVAEHSITPSGLARWKTAPGYASSKARRRQKNADRSADAADQ